MFPLDRDHYAADTGHVAVKFGSDDTKYVFPRELLAKHFKYFKTALQMNGAHAVFVEGEVNHVIHLEEIDAAAFSHLIQYASDLVDGAYANSQGLDLLIQAIITADYLGLDSPRCTLARFESDMLYLMRKSLLYDHKIINAKHLDLAENHSAFMNKKLWCLLAQAGVRPYIQQYMLDSSDKLEDIEKLCPTYSTWAPDGWLMVLKHHRKLRNGNEQYALKVMKEVSKALHRTGWLDWHSEGEISDQNTVLYEEPLYTGLKAEDKPLYSYREYQFAV
jgi:hypothetical protein